MSEPTPIRREVIVPIDPAVAFRVFIDRIGTWWPTAAFSVLGAGSSVAFFGHTLVAAGPLEDEPGSGLTILRLPGLDRLVEATRLATIEDASVAGGFFTVDVRPWNVVMSAATTGG